MAPKAKTLLHVDTTDVEQKVEALRGILTDKEMRLLLSRTFKRTAQHVRTLVARDVTHDYHVNYGYALGSIGQPRMSSGAGIECVMPVKNARKKMGREGGGHYFKAVARSGKTGRKISAKKFRAVGARGGYAVQAFVVKGGVSSLPSSGENAHFMVSSGAHEGKVYVRKGDGSTYMATVKYQAADGSTKTYQVKKASIRPGVGIGVPQMPVNRSESEIQQDTQEVLVKRFEHEYEVIIQGLAKGGK